MLVFTRKKDQKIVIELKDSCGEIKPVTVGVAKETPGRLKINISAPKDIKIETILNTSNTKTTV